MISPSRQRVEIKNTLLSYILQYNNVCLFNNNKQLLNGVEHDIVNYQGRGWRYLPKPKVELDNTNRGLDNCRYHAKTEFNNCFILYSQQKKKNYANGTHENFMPS